MSRCAAGAGFAAGYFGHDEFAEHAPGMKIIDDALELRGRIFGAFELAELEALDRLPGVAQVAIQGGRPAARQILRRLRGEPAGQPFRYRDKGSMATISRFSAVATVGRLRLAGLTGWLLWLAVHLLYLVGFKNRVTAVLHWFVSFIGRGRSERTVTLQQVVARTALQEVTTQAEPPAVAAAGGSDGSADAPADAPGQRTAVPGPEAARHGAPERPTGWPSGNDAGG
ncbi:NAD(P)/FAD-dependent oxidoreductase [Micromonospora craniellae]|uniref:hypothetical protein n=1 Tax=Micromonospora craniellae TaxID=2294034 RepID=UPI00168BF7BC|nr:hypothetical protein [Micromonospora craniellae]QOC92115.1 hypothetical protein ID554_30420 [Micromonospora craniellae]